VLVITSMITVVRIFFRSVLVELPLIDATVSRFICDIFSK